jgi:hypothetical protein
MAMSVRTLLLAGGVLGAAIIGGPVAAQQVIDGVGMVDAETVLQQSQTRSFDMNMREDSARRFAPSTPGPAAGPALADPDNRQLELEFAATGENAGVPLDVSVARRASLRANEDGDIDGSSGGSELRIGRGLVREDDGENREGSSIYMFVADDDEALTWAPGSQGNSVSGRSGGLALQERVDVGDMSAGVTYERNGVQASLAYVERSVTTQVGRESFSQDESFTGVTVTMRR